MERSAVERHRRALGAPGASMLAEKLRRLIPGTSAELRQRLESLGDIACCAALAAAGALGLWVLAWMASRVAWPG